MLLIKPNAYENERVQLSLDAEYLTVWNNLA